MAPSWPRRFRFSLLAAPLVAFSALVLIAGTAKASCLHPAGVTWANDLDRATTTFEIFRIEQAPIKGPADPNPLPGAPCSGPQCKEQSMPTRVPVHVAPIKAHDGCLSTALNPRPPSDSANLVGTEPLVAATRLHSAPERPPRAR